MKQPIQAEEELITETHLEAEASQWEQLAQGGCSSEEIVALLWLRGRYQTGGSDCTELVRNFEFLKWLIRASMREEYQGDDHVRGERLFSCASALA